MTEMVRDREGDRGRVDEREGEKEEGVDTSWCVREEWRDWQRVQGGEKGQGRCGRVRVCERVSERR